MPNRGLESNRFLVYFGYFLHTATKLDTLIDNLGNLLWGGAASISDGIFISQSTSLSLLQDQAGINSCRKFS